MMAYSCYAIVKADSGQDVGNTLLEGLEIMERNTLF